MNQKHTSLPWEYFWRTDDAGDPDCGIYYYDLRNAYSIARCPKYQSQEKWEADAKFIVTACNSYEQNQQTIKELRSALKNISRIKIDPDDVINRMTLFAAISVAEEALS